MANTIRIKKRASSSAAGAPSTLAPSELAFNENTGDLKLYYGYGDNGSGEASSIIVIGGSGGFFNKTDTRSANTILSGPTTGSAAAPTFRSLVAADIPSIAHTKISDFDTGVRVNRLDQMASATAVVSGVTPTADAHFATKGYVDTTAQGLDVKDSCKVASTGNLTLSGTQTIDGVAISADERVLCKDQSTSSENGIYLCKAGSWARADDMAAGEDAAGAFTFIEQGSTYADVGFVCSSNKGSAVVGTNNLAFTQFSGVATVTAGDGLDKSGNELSVDLKSNGGLVIESTELAVDLGASSITNTLAVANGGTGSTSASDARTALGLAIGSNVQAYDAGLNAIAGLATTDGGFIVGNGSTFVLESGATVRTSLGLSIGSNVQAHNDILDDLAGLTQATDKLPYFSSSTAASTTDLTSFARTILDDANASAVRTTIGVAIGSDVQAYDAQLADVAGLAVTDGGFIVGNGSNFVLETAGTARTSLGLGSMATQANDAVNIDGGTIDGITLDGGTY